MKLFEWFKKFKYRAVAVSKWTVRWVDNDGTQIPGDQDTGYWVMMENGFGKRKFKCVGAPTLLNVRSVPGTALWLFGSYPVFLLPMCNTCQIQKNRRRK